jgi:hypothetical protein
MGLISSHWKSTQRHLPATGIFQHGGFPAGRKIWGDENEMLCRAGRVRLLRGENFGG